MTSPEQLKINVRDVKESVVIHYPDDFSPPDVREGEDALTVDFQNDEDSGAEAPKMSGDAPETKGTQNSAEKKGPIPAEGSPPKTEVAQQAIGTTARPTMTQSEDPVFQSQRSKHILSLGRRS